ncbi:hypothetical protein B296_00051096 [Ensete ventricosum]|uniref:Uncharacterized protein n=1 Tax=Ensete ventricosum TaxID=4639 RepID=A0A426YIA0_ENSVE|nr:hypothetical protein B296_00051096 [Ensete ventricosum]
MAKAVRDGSCKLIIREFKPNKGCQIEQVKGGEVRYCGRNSAAKAVVTKVEMLKARQQAELLRNGALKLVLREVQPLEEGEVGYGWRYLTSQVEGLQFQCGDPQLSTVVAARHASPPAKMEGCVVPGFQRSEWIVGDEGLEGEEGEAVSGGLGGGGSLGLGSREAHARQEQNKEKAAGPNYGAMPFDLHSDTGKNESGDILYIKPICLT